MKRAELEHIIRAAASVADVDELIIVGSQAILGQYPNAPHEMCVSNEADVYPKHFPERADLIDGAIGEDSQFHETFGYYAQGVGPTTAVLPIGWADRLVPVFGPATRGATGWCLEVHDIVLSKLVAGREKDLEYAKHAVAFGLARVDELAERLETMSIEPVLLDRLRARVGALRLRPASP